MTWTLNLKRTPSAYLGSCRFKLPDISQTQKSMTRFLTF